MTSSTHQRMRTLTCTLPGRLQYGMTGIPVLQKDTAIIKIRRIGVCGTDLHAFEGTQPFFSYPRVLGHELSGELMDFDNAPGFEKGEAVTFIPYSSCGQCIACRSSKPNCCTAIQVYGVHKDGGMAEYLLVPSSSLLHGEGLSFDELAMVEPLAIGAHGVRRAAARKGEFVLVVGAGPIGIGIMEFAALEGANVIALDLIDERLEFSRSKGVHEIINASSADVLSRLNELTGGDLPPVVIDATGNLGAIKQAFNYLAHGGRYVLVGLQKGDISFSHPEFHKREATLMSSRNATKEDFEYVISCIKDGRISPLDYIGARAEFDDAAELFPSWTNASSGLIKAMITLG